MKREDADGRAVQLIVATTACSYLLSTSITTSPPKGIHYASIWSIRELVDEIMSQLNCGSLFNAIRICRTFFEPAATVLWEKVSTRELLSIISERKPGVLTPLPNNFDRVARYSRLIRSLSIPCDITTAVGYVVFPVLHKNCDLALFSTCGWPASRLCLLISLSAHRLHISIGACSRVSSKLPGHDRGRSHFACMVAPDPPQHPMNFQVLLSHYPSIQKLTLRMDFPTRRLRQLCRTSPSRYARCCFTRLDRSSLHVSSPNAYIRFVPTWRYKDTRARHGRQLRSSLTRGDTLAEYTTRATQ
ncbi:hypothetical protein CALCODRAFT_42004 [Calocera cornea HHB12733]|uniref:F-box domain-containing protein n=1 Tax=Calocera cornea HHB12733 TaxID=1353952 RepID=A0A165DWL0_9BASI|nr:hypothetical protein CALCODRAFT_42004 [Calocera cornea HHB12733]